MRVLVTGAAGQLGQDVVRTLSARGHEVIARTREHLDITDAASVRSAMEGTSPDLVINTAAYTAVDAAETEVDKAFAVNATGALYVAREAHRCGAGIVHISTDYVFRGESSRTAAYKPDDLPSPRNVYGASKLAGEHLVRQSNPRHWIVRTQWLYGNGGSGNFVETMLRLGSGNRTLRIIDDQVGSPTFTAHLAEAIVELLTEAPGTYHRTNSGQCSWFEFAQAIWQMAGMKPTAQPILTEEYGAAADRPRFSVLGDDRGPAWTQGLADYMSRRSP